jgi:hypothetical protein
MNPDTIYAMTGILAVLLGGITLMIPILGLTLRFALKPVVETWANARALPAADRQTESLSRQVALLETELQQVQHALNGLLEAQEFQRRLEGEKHS